MCCPEIVVNSLFKSAMGMDITLPIRGDVHMTSALTGGEGVSQFLTKGREVA